MTAEELKEALSARCPMVEWTVTATRLPNPSKVDVLIVDWQANVGGYRAAGQSVMEQAFVLAHGPATVKRQIAEVAAEVGKAIEGARPMTKVERKRRGVNG